MASTLRMVLLCVECAAVATVQHDDDGGASIALDSLAYAGGPRLLVTVNPEDKDGKHLTSRRLLLDTGSATLAFCDVGLASKVSSLQTEYYACDTYGGDGSDSSGYWGAFYKGTVDLRQSDVNVTITQAYFSVMQQQFGMPCDSGFQGIFGIAPLALDEATLQKPSSWPSSRVGSCPKHAIDLNNSPLIQYVRGLEGNHQLGIYWSGKVGNGEGRLYLGKSATNNPYFDAHAAARIGSAQMSLGDNYNINVKDLQFEGRSYDVQCGGDNAWQCSLDTGCPSLTLPQDIYDAMMRVQSGELAVLLERVDGGIVKLRFDVQTLVSNRWISVSTETILGLPLRAFYYTVMDISSSALHFTPMAAYFQQVISDSLVFV